MNNIELRLTAEKNWREENLLKCINNRGTRGFHKSKWTLFGVFPALTDTDLFRHSRKIKK